VPDAAYRDELARVHLGDAPEVLRELPEASLDALVTDPPAGISFMGKEWDDFRRCERFVAWMTARATECLRVLKPGAHGLVWAIPRTSHLTATALEDAGFEVRDVITHHFGSGFPKSLDVSKAIDKAAGAERELLEEGPRVRGIRPGADQVRSGTWEKLADRTHTQSVATPVTNAARRWGGWGTALKPASEHWILVRRPLAEPSVAANVLVHGTGGLNIDGCRAASGLGGDRDGEPSARRRYGQGPRTFSMTPGPRNGDGRGRWPANLVLSHAEGCRRAGTSWVPTGTAVRRGGVVGGHVYSGGRWGHQPGTPDLTYAGSDGLEAVEAWHCVNGCPVAELDRQSGVARNGSGIASARSGGIGGGLFGDGEADHIGGGFGDVGGASRFFYVAKAGAGERSHGLPPGWLNRHPTVKPVELMRWLVRLVTPAGGVVLDPFAGSGTTLVAAKLEGFRSIGIEREAETVEVCRQRLAWAIYQPSLLAADEEEGRAMPD
jgi:site-specific DNA-methyltransferase (adenine-specific)